MTIKEKFILAMDELAEQIRKLADEIMALEDAMDEAENPDAFWKLNSKGRGLDATKYSLQLELIILELCFTKFFEEDRDYTDDEIKDAFKIEFDKLEKLITNNAENTTEAFNLLEYRKLDDDYRKIANKGLLGFKKEAKYANIHSTLSMYYFKFFDCLYPNYNKPE